jgi:hypothetical protein
VDPQDAVVDGNAAPVVMFQPWSVNPALEYCSRTETSVTPVLSMKQNVPLCVVKEF